MGIQWTLGREAARNRPRKNCSIVQFIQEQIQLEQSSVRTITNFQIFFAIYEIWFRVAMTIMPRGKFLIASRI